MGAMVPVQRIYAKMRFRQVVEELHTAEFEKFFHRLMELSAPDYVPVRTHGNIGDRGADGLSLHEGSLYACYGPEVFNAEEVRSKFRKDLNSAVTHRSGQFSTFVFVHNDRRRGIHPEISKMIQQAQLDHHPVKFQQLGPDKLWYKAMVLDVVAIEELLDCQIPIENLVFGISDLAPLIEHLRSNRPQPDQFRRVEPPPAAKIEFNELGDEVREFLVIGLRSTHLISAYFQGRLDAYAEDQVAAGFTAYYDEARRELEHRDSEKIIARLQEHIHGNKIPTPSASLAGWGILAYFFERCHIFETPPADWSGSTAEQAAT
ncbi:hypothetical protein UA75_06010 [Actinoalloteichus sp. GBA129-24]|nr:hypothetical protein UA75_06010 [Actinoalloteichus sp. GBA129-24]